MNETKKSKLPKIAALVLAAALIVGLGVWAILGSLGGDDTGSNSTQAGTQSGTANVTSDGAIDASALFSSRDLRQAADLQEAVTREVTDGSDISITTAGVYILSGSAKNATICVEADKEDRVQLVLNGLEVVNDDSPVIYVKCADKVFITTAENSENTLSVTGTFTADGTTNTDAVIFSKDDLVLNGLGSLTIESSDNGISGKDGIKLTGGILRVTAADCAIEVNDYFAMSDGTVTLSAGNDGVHSENDGDTSLGWIYISGGTMDITAADDALHALSIAQIDGGVFHISAAEGIEASWAQINDGELTIAASDDGINGARKSTVYSTCVEINGGALTITMAQGDTDGIDSNGDLTITGGTISVNAQSAFDWDGTLTWTGGTVSVNGTEVTEITNQFGVTGGFTGGPGGMGGFPGGGSGGSGRP